MHRTTPHPSLCDTFPVKGKAKKKVKKLVQTLAAGASPCPTDITEKGKAPIIDKCT
ncbi:MAG: hypothetical protein IJC36_04280 [Clostridia bacterium]|nr:hypothetical protein [Clostridia bacterium]